MAPNRSGPPRLAVIVVLFTCLIHLGRSTIHRTACPPTASSPQPPRRVNTTERVAALRREMKRRGIDAYLIPAVDPHLNEYIGPEFARRQWISGFSGSQGDALVTSDKAVLQIDARYPAQADMETDCGWEIIKSPAEDLASYLKTWSSGRSQVTIGVDTRLMSGLVYDGWMAFCKASNFKLVGGAENLVDIVWRTDRPKAASKAVFVHPLQYAGETWTSKIEEVRREMTSVSTGALIVTKLDEIAWLFNLRGSDIPFNPVFYAFAIVELSNIRLYLREPKIHGPSIGSHLNNDAGGGCSANKLCVQIKDYNLNFTNDLRALVQENKTKVWVSKWDTNYFVINLAGNNTQLDRTPIYAMKVVKNAKETKSFFECSIVDSAAYVEFVARLERGMLAGERWTEMKAVRKLEEIRKTYQNYHGPSFSTISSSGPNAAINHYEPDNFTDRPLSTQEIYLLDAGSQFLGCTTDITRTFHFGKPTPKMIEAYTRVLMGFINVADSVWPQYTTNPRLESGARSSLWKGGLDYEHGTGHGVGTFLYVHEYPNGFMTRGSNYVLKEGNFQSCEPGYYENGFGIRLETVLGVKVADTKYRFNNYEFYKFYPAAFVPFERKLIDMNLLSDMHTKWLNRYHKDCQLRIGTILRQNKKTDTLKWLEERTATLSRGRASGKLGGGLELVMACVIIPWIIKPFFV